MTLPKRVSMATLVEFQSLSVRNLKILLKASIAHLKSGSPLL